MAYTLGEPEEQPTWQETARAGSQMERFRSIKGRALDTARRERQSPTAERGPAPAPAPGGFLYSPHIGNVLPDQGWQSWLRNYNAWLDRGKERTNG